MWKWEEKPLSRTTAQMNGALQKYIKDQSPLYLFLYLSGCLDSYNISVIKGRSSAITKMSKYMNLLSH